MAKVQNPRGHLKFLVVDDVANMRKTLRSMLRMIGFTDVTEADDGDTGLAKLRQQKMDFVIADWNMPRMPGVEMLRHIREDPMLRDMPFLVITGEVDEAQVVRAAEEDVDGYIVKPFVADTLEKKINAVFERRANPPQVEVHLKLGYAYKENGMLKEAMAEFEKARELKPKSARIPMAMAQIFEAMGDNRKAEELFNVAISFNPRFVKAYHTIADFQAKLGNEEAALAALKTATELSPTNVAKQLELGKMLVKAGRMEEADATFKAAVKAVPKNSHMMAEIGEVYLASGHDDKAADAFKSSLNINQDIHIYNRLGIALRRKKRFKEAIEEYGKAIALAPDDEVLHYNIGRAYLEDGQRAKAIDSFNKALRLDPDFDECKKALAQVDPYGW